MLENKNKISVVKAWLSEFLLPRILSSKPDGRPLYGYQVTEEEFSRLLEVLKNASDDIKSPVHKKFWSACFCLYVAESYRRSYDASDGGWTWKGFTKAISVNLSPVRLAEIVDEGLVKFWRRSIRMRTNGRDYLGSLFAEGGLPWKLVQSDTHGFGRAVRAGIGKYYENRDSRRSTSDFLEDYLPYLPQSFRTQETKQLLTGIIEQLVTLVEQHSISDKEDPASYLDQVYPEWKQAFPIPLGEENGRNLVNDWLRRADKSRGERLEQSVKVPEPQCTHWLEGDRCPNRQVITEIALPGEFRFAVDLEVLRSTRFELAFYEDEALLRKAGAVYGQLSGDEDRGFEITVRLPKRHFKLSRNESADVLRLVFLSNGREVFNQAFEESTVAFLESPLLFELGDHGWLLVGTGSCHCRSPEILLWLPQGYEVVSGDVDHRHSDADGSWMMIAGETKVRIGDEGYRFIPGSIRPAGERLHLRGCAMMERSLPNSVFRGWPEVALEGGASAAESHFPRYINSKRAFGDSTAGRYGAFRFRVTNQEGDTLLRRKFGVLPQDLLISVLPAGAATSAKVLLKTTAELQARAVGEDLLDVEGQVVDDVLAVELTPRGPRPPARFRLLLRSSATEEPIELRLDYPFEGVRYFDGSGAEKEPREVLLNQLLGSQLVLSSGRGRRQLFNIEMQLFGYTGRNIRRNYVIPIADKPVPVSLFAFSEDIKQMLGATASQDSYIRFSIDAQRPLMHFDIRRYNGAMNQDAATVRLESDRSTNVGGARKIEAMLLSDPARKPLELEEVMTCDVGMGTFELPHAMSKNGPWVIYPREGAVDQFRPALVSGGRTEVEDDDINSLHAAARAYHPTDNPTVIDAQVARMADKLSHSGWTYLEEAWSNFQHLPLSVFEAWKALVGNPRALALAVFRLDIDEAMALRFQDDLSAVWEFIPLATWRDAYIAYTRWLEDSGVPPLFAERIIKKRKETLSRLVSGYEEMTAYLSGGDTDTLRQVGSGQMLAIIFQQLRCTYPEIDTWPGYLGAELRQWVLAQDLDNYIHGLSNTHETNAVAYLPVFLGHVTAGLAQPADLGVDQNYLKFAIRAIADFDRQGWFIPAHAAIASYLMTK